ncbi:MAG: thiamine pyrophosphate-dependent enzyme [Endomicrobia bacterium]|nr:thiamine pyrophosphate-dependent enzyme [Endomicrobiia bacterium]MDW8056401.1 thiamine pyrophosphate-dependent enzyme [Elusimicrobiota bacterium]
MSESITKPNPYFKEYLPQEYKDIVEKEAFKKNKSFLDLGVVKELLEEHPLCAGCNLALSLKLILVALPNPEDTIIVGSTGCSSLALAQVGIHNIHSLFGNQNAVATGLKRALSIRFPDKVKDVVVMAGDGATADIGLDMTLHSWFRKEKITTIMFDNEIYANTGGQESGMTPCGRVVNMAPKGKKFSKINMPEIAKTSGCDYVAAVSVAKPKSVFSSVRKAILVAREIGPTYVQIFTPCPTNLKIKSSEAIIVAEEKVKQGEYPISEYISPQAEEYLKNLGELSQ